jgi:hypothetical protein
MTTFEVYVDDDRYAVPSLYLVTARGEARGRAMAEALWRESDHHRGVELRLHGERLYGVGSMASVRGPYDRPDLSPA